jgi:hypothetical protein
MMSEDEFQPEPPRRPRRAAREEDVQEDRPPRRERRSRPREDEEEDLDRFRRQDGGVGALIPYRNPQALIAYYCGVFALIPCAGLLLGPVAIVLGMLGLNYKKKHPTAGGAGHAITGIVLGTLTVLGHLAVFLLVGLGALMK